MAYKMNGWPKHQGISPLRQDQLPIADIMTVLGGGGGDVELTEGEKEKGGYYTTGGGSTSKERILKKIKDYKGGIDERT